MMEADNVEEEAVISAAKEIGGCDRDLDFTGDSVIPASEEHDNVSQETVSILENSAEPCNPEKEKCISSETLVQPSLESSLVEDKTCEDGENGSCPVSATIDKDEDEDMPETINGNGAETSLSTETNNMQVDIEEDSSITSTKLGPAPDDQEISQSSSYYCWRYDLPTNFTPKCMITTSKDEFCTGQTRKKKANYLKGCKWAPDGSCLLSCSDDDTLRLFNFPSSFSSIQDWNSCDDIDLVPEDWRSVLKIKEGGLIYDYCWYPLMSSVDPVSCCLLTTSSLSPIHLWDAFTGTLRASYHPYNHLDQVISAYSIAFGSSGDTIYSGFDKSIRIFNLTRPGRECTERKLKQPVADLNQHGIIASIVVNPSLQSFYALGSFDKTIGLYYEDGSVICLLQGHTGGVTHMKFSSDGMKLFTGGRKDSRLICWDMRQLGETYKIYERVVTTHQRVYFDVSADGRYLVTGGTDGVVKAWDLYNDDEQPCLSFKGSSDCVNGASLNPYVPLLATSSGQRHLPEVVEDSDDEDLFSDSNVCRDESCDIKLWKMV